MNYIKKYLKYKKKYNNLKKKIYGGSLIKENTCTINEYKKIRKLYFNNINDYEIWSAKKKSNTKALLLNIVDLKDI